MRKILLFGVLCLSSACSPVRPVYSRTATPASPTAPTPHLTLIPTITVTPTLISTPTLAPLPTPAGSSTPVGGGNGEFVVADSRAYGGGIVMLDANLKIVKYLVPPRKENGITEYLPFAPAWSPGGEKIAYMVHLLIAFAIDKQGHMRGYDAIYLMKPDGTQQSRIFVSKPRIETSLKPGITPSLSWSPDGRRIAFHSDLNGNTQIYIINRDGSGLTQLTKGEDEAMNPSWSPDGTKIAYSVRVSNNRAESNIYVINLEDHVSTQLTDLPGREFDPAWSPDGTRIAFISEQNRRDNIFLTNPDGTEIVQVTGESYEVYNYLNWSPDGKLITFDRASSAHPSSIRHEAWIMNADGTSPHVLSQNFGFFDWRPQTAP